MSCPRMRVEQTVLLVVDMQEKLLPHMTDATGIIRQVGRLVDGANTLKVPVLVTEQYRKGLGVTVEPIASRLKSVVCCQEKLKFSACIEPVREALSRLQRRTVLVCGVEAHVCVMQTCLDLLSYGFITAVALDAIDSRRSIDCDTAVSRMIQAGVIPTTVESALLELVQEAGGERFKTVLELIKNI